MFGDLSVPLPWLPARVHEATMQSSGESLAPHLACHVTEGVHPEIESSLDGLSLHLACRCKVKGLSLLVPTAQAA